MNDVLGLPVLTALVVHRPPRHWQDAYTLLSDSVAADDNLSLGLNGSTLEQSDAEFPSKSTLLLSDPNTAKI